MSAEPWGGLIGLGLLGLAAWVIVRLIQNSLQEAERKRRQEEKQREEEAKRKAEEEELEQQWRGWYLYELNRAKLLSRTDKEIELWAKRHAKEILAKEAEIMEKAGKTILRQDVIDYLEEQPEGELVKAFLQEPLKELKIAKAYIASGGEKLAKIEQALAEEELQASVARFRKNFEKQFNSESEGQNEQPKNLKGLTAEDLQTLKGVLDEYRKLKLLERDQQTVLEREATIEPDGFLRRVGRGLLKAARLLRRRSRKPLSLTRSRANRRGQVKAR